MRLKKIHSTLLLALLLGSVAAYGKKSVVYQQGTITKESGGYVVAGSDNTKYKINRCGDFQNGQALEYRVEEVHKELSIRKELYIRQENGKEGSCTVKSWEGPSPSTIAAEKTYQKGTIMGWNTRLDIYPGSSSGNSVNMTFGNKRRTRIYELKGASMIYQIDDCGSFQAGQFKPGQAVDYRVDESNTRDRRVYILRDNGQEYKCRMEGARAIEGAKADAPSVPASPQQ